MKGILRAATVGLLVAAGAAATAASARDQAPVISRNGVGQVKLGASYDELREAKAIRKIESGCEVVPGSRFAELKSPLEGVVNFTTSGEPTAETIVISGGDTSTRKGIGIGDRKKDVKNVYPDAEFNTTTKPVFGIITVTVKHKFEIAIDANTKKVTLIGVRSLPVCE